MSRFSAEESWIREVLLQHDQVLLLVHAASALLLLLPSIILYLVNSLQRAWGPPVNYHFRKSLQRTHSILSYLLTTCSYREKSR